MHIISTLGNTDIYLLDQYMRGRIQPGMKILDAGCGHGRNSELAVRLGYEVHGIDLDAERIEHVHTVGPDWGKAFNPSNFTVGDIRNTMYPGGTFDFIICMAVLHFAKGRDDFAAMFSELVRVLKPGGHLWFRMTVKHTLEHLSTAVGDDIYDIPDESRRFLLDRTYLEELMRHHRLTHADRFKTVNVDDIRSMCVVCLEREISS